jgi:hypothetical protein
VNAREHAVMSIVGICALASACGPVGFGRRYEEMAKIDVAVYPASATLTPGASQHFTATVSVIADQSVTWSVAEAAGCGVVDANGLYTAPLAVADPIACHVVASSEVYASASGAATVQVSADTRYRPGITATWQWQMSGALDSSYDVGLYVVDLFDSASADIQSLHTQGRKIACWFSAGTAEDWRPDYSRFLPADQGNAVGSGEYWLDITSANVQAVMQSRLDLAVTKACDAVVPSSVDIYAASGTGLPVMSSAQQLTYNRFLATEAHSRALSAALSNCVGLIADLVADFDFTLNEQCHLYNECGYLQSFVAAGKAALNAEYASSLSAAQTSAASICPPALEANLRTIIIPSSYDDSFRVSCD